MLKTNGVKSFVSLLLVSAILFGFCACRSKNNNKEKTTSASAAGQTSADVPTVQTTGVTSTSAQSEQKTSYSQPMTERSDPETTRLEKTTAKTSAQTKTQKDDSDKTTELSGVETLTDGEKTVVYPLMLKKSQKKYPVIVWANGTGCPTRLYTVLLEELAGGGYIVVADSDMMSNDGKTQIDSVDYVISKNSDPSSILYNKVNICGIGACGHSQGGRSSVNAAQADKRIRCVVSIAGASSADEARGLSVPCLFLTGTNDLVVVSSVWCKPSYNAVTGRAAYASLKGAVHTTCMINPQKVSGYTISWFDAYLKNDPQAKEIFADGGKLSNDKNWRDFQNKN